MGTKNSYLPPLSMKFWYQVGENYYADLKELLKAIADCGRSESELAREMCAGGRYLQDLKEGRGVEYWSAHFVDHFIKPVAQSLEVDSPTFIYAQVG